MKKQRIEIIITSVLGVVLIIGAVKVISTAKTTKPQSAAPSVKKTFSEPKAAITKKFDAIKSEAEKMGWERNPFVRGRASSASGALFLNLTGIIWDEQNPAAIIGDAVVKEGDVLGKYKVIKITKDSVVISSDDEGEKTLRIWEEE